MEAQYISGSTRITGLLGNPVSHSLSPLIHNHAFKTLGLDYVYLPLGTKEEELPTLVAALKALGFAGANVTIPYKSAIIPFCDSLSELSQCTGTVNTLYWDEGKLCGTTTDGIGFLSALRDDNFSLEHKHVTILGNGGTARTLAMILGLDKKVASLTLLGRSAEKVATLAREIKEQTNFTVSSATIGTSEGNTHLAITDLLVNCTSVGMHPHEETSPISLSHLPSSCYIFDAIYNPEETLLLKEGRAKGCRTQNGLRMLLLQGLASFSYWTGHTISPEAFNLEELQQLVTKRG